MAGHSLTVMSTLQCPHGGTVQIVSSNQKAKAGGGLMVTATDTFTIAGCPFQIPVGAGTKPQPCVRVQWTVPAVRVLINGTPALLATSVGLDLSVEGIPQGPPVVSTVQPRVVAT